MLELFKQSGFDIKSEVQFVVDDRVPNKFRQQIHIEQMTLVNRAAMRGNLPLFK